MVAFFCFFLLMHMLRLFLTLLISFLFLFYSGSLNLIYQRSLYSSYQALLHPFPFYFLRSSFKLSLVVTKQSLPVVLLHSFCKSLCFLCSSALRSCFSHLTAISNPFTLILYFLPNLFLNRVSTFFCLLSLNLPRSRCICYKFLCSYILHVLYLVFFEGPSLYVIMKAQAKSSVKLPVST